jgi:hypothetical protein
MVSFGVFQQYQILVRLAGIEDLPQFSGHLKMGGLRAAN